MIARLVGRPVREPSHRWILVLVAALFVTIMSPALAQDSATYGARPAPGEGDRSSGSFVLSVGIGSAISDAVEIFNLADEPAAFDVYAVDAERTSSGRVAGARGAEPPTGPAAWVAVDLTVVEVPPRSSALVAFTVAVPDDTPLGDHLAALMVEPHQAVDAGTIVSRTRVGLWVEIEVHEGSDAAPVVPPGPAISWDVPWIPIIAVAMIAFAAVLLYVSRRRWHAWLEQWREERALIRDFRSRRRHEAATDTHGRRG